MDTLFYTERATTNEPCEVRVDEPELVFRRWQQPAKSSRLRLILDSLDSCRSRTARWLPMVV